jgi:putative endonuclease
MANHSIRKYCIYSLLAVVPLGFLFKFYSGPGRRWFNDFGACLFYEIFWILIVFLFLPKKKWVVYLARCADNSLYCGGSNDLSNRLKEHNLGKGAKYTRSRRPVELVGGGPQMTKSEALKLEFRIKRLPRDQKIIELTSKETQMTVTKTDLQSLQRQFKALEKKMDKLIAAAGKSEKHKAAKKAPTKKAPAKRAAKLTATNQVLEIIKRSKNGVNIKTLMDKTGFNNKKVTNILQRTYKQVEIKRVGKGVCWCLNNDNLAVGPILLLIS